MDRLEQVRLAGAVVPDDEDEAGRQVELGGGVGTVLVEGEATDDQPASRIGMIR